MKSENQHTKKSGNKSGAKSSKSRSNRGSPSNSSRGIVASLSAGEIGKTLGGYKSTLSRNTEKFLRNNSNGVFITLSFLGGLAAAYLFRTSEWEREYVGRPMRRGLDTVKDTISEKTEEIVNSARERVQHVVDHVVQ